MSSANNWPDAGQHGQTPFDAFSNENNSGYGENPGTMQAPYSQYDIGSNNYGTRKYPSLETGYALPPFIYNEGLYNGRSSSFAQRDPGYIAPPLGYGDMSYNSPVHASSSDRYVSPPLSMGRNDMAYHPPPPASSSRRRKSSGISSGTESRASISTRTRAPVVPYLSSYRAQNPLPSAPKPAPIVAPAVVPRKMSGQESKSMRIVFEVVGAIESWDKPPVVSYVVNNNKTGHKSYKLVGGDNLIWKTRKISSPTISWLFDWPGLTKRNIQVMECAFLSESGRNIPMNKLELAHEICRFFVDAIRQQREDHRRFTQVFHDQASQEKYHLQKVNAVKLRLESFDYFKEAKLWCPRFSYE